ncbi:uncharacterized protein TNCV_3731451 [Trichonephila clavipes]|nr:uncharacterized protein TNCV_3731451 [Trichonephila clavipes]
MTNLGLNILNAVPCYCHHNDVGGAEYHQRQYLRHHLAHQWLTHVLVGTFLPTVLLHYSQGLPLIHCDIPSHFSLGEAILIDEAHFWLNGYVNKQNCRIWSEANPQVYVETPLHPEKLTVWCALWAGGILLQKR